MKISDIVCPSCLASYEVAESTSVKGSPGRAECSVCGALLASWQESKLRAYRLTSPPESARVERSTKVDITAPQFAVAEGITSDFSREAYLAAVARAVEYIHAGDIFQVNLSQRLLMPATSSSVELYERLRLRNAATFAGYFDLGDYQLASASPERFLEVRGDAVETRPIKGTRPRTARPEADASPQ